MVAAILLVLTIALMIAMFFTVRFARRRLRRMFERWVEDGGWTYQAASGGSWAAGLPSGIEPKITVQVGAVQRGRAVTVAQYVIKVERYDSDGDLNRQPLDYTVAAVQLPDGYPDMARWQWRGPSKGWEQRYPLRADEYELSCRLPAEPALGPAMERLSPTITRSLRDNSPWRVSGGCVVIMYPGQIFPPFTEALLHKALDIADMLPAPEAFGTR